MNQILVTNFKKNHKPYFKIQLVVSLVAMIGIVLYLSNQHEEEADEEYLSHILNQSIEIAGLYTTEKTDKEESLELGKIYIDKIALEYPVLNQFSEELLKIAPCKFYGVGIGEKGNLCIVGHNYNDQRFFGRLKELEVKDCVRLMDMQGKEYVYTIFDIFETEEDDVASVLNYHKDYELTLLTCNNANRKRMVVKALMQNE